MSHHSHGAKSAKRLKLALAAGIAALSLGTAGNAEAAAYGFASQQISNFAVTATMV